MRFTLACCATAVLGACAAGPTASTSGSSAFVLVLDVSGSMTGPWRDVLPGAWAAVAKELGDDGLLGVLAFNERPRWIAPLGRPDEVGVHSLNAAGASDLAAALMEASRGLEASAGLASRKHVIVVSDGNTKATGLQAAVERLAAIGATLSCVCVSTTVFDAPLLSKLADEGKGAFLFIVKPESLSRALVQETRRLRR